MLEKIKKHWPYLVILLIITIVYMFYFFNSNLPVHDIATYYYPLAQTLKTSALEYKDFWPLWTPYGFSGSPFLMKPLLGIDSLLGILILTIPNTVIALKLTYVILFLVSGISMYSLMIYLKLDKKFAFVSALIYILNAQMAKLLVWGWLTTLGGYSILPLAFLFGIKSVKEKEWVKNSIITGIVFAILFRLNPDMKVTMWLGLLLGLYLIFNLITKPSKKRLTKIIVVALLIILVFFGLSAQRMINNMNFIKDTSRGETSWQISSGRRLKYNEITNRVIEPIYNGMPQIQREGKGDHIGVIAFLLGVFAIYKKRKSKMVLFFALGALFSILVTTNTFNLYYLLWRFVPFFKSLRYMDRSLFLFVFCFSILAGIGAKELLQKFKRYQKTAYVILIGLIIINLWLFSYSHYTGGDPNKWLNAEEAIENNYILQNLSGTPGIFRIQTWETRGIDWNTDFYNVPLKLEHIYKYDSMWYPPYMNVYLSVSFNNPAKFWGILNLKYLTSQNELNLSGFKLVEKFQNCTVCFPEANLWAKAWGPYLYENELFLPRAYIVNNSILVVGEEEAAIQTIYALMLDPNFKPYNTVVIGGKKSINDYEVKDLKKYSVIFLTQGSIDQNSIFKLQQYVNSGGILLPDVTKNKNTISEDEINNVFNSFKGGLNPIEDKNIITHNFDKREIKLNEQKGFLVYSEKFSVFDGWKANSAKTKKEVYNADSMISAIYLEGNEESITFEYKPQFYKTSIIITIITILLLTAYFICKIYKKHKTLNKDSN